ncbi:MAG: LLM class flavin-dependent oxidoreductase [Hyphomicrobiaceae bacterium]|nr:LLM class flavin-dependent oxidoreductase [Hyphomicrobiaceae bacterium]
MPVRILGMIGVTPPASDAQLIIIEGQLSADYVVASARAHEAAGYDMALVGYTSSSAEGFLVALHAAHHTERLAYLVAHRPGFVQPTLMARKIATFDQLTRGRLAVHIITGKTDAEQWGDGDFSPKPERYERAAEYLTLMRQTWRESRPFDFDGRFYRVKGALSDVRPFQQPHPEILFGGASEGALAMGAEHCDTYAMYAEPLAAAATRIGELRARAARFGRTIGFNISARPIIADTEAAAWEKARSILAKLEGGASRGWSRQEQAKEAVDNAGRRLMEFAAEKELHDTCLWMPITRATGALGNTSALVGTPAQVADAILAYYRLGVGSFLIRGFDPAHDTTDFGRELIPRIKAGAAAVDAEPE